MFLLPTKLQSIVHILGMQGHSKGEGVGKATLTPVLHKHTIPICYGT